MWSTSGGVLRVLAVSRKTVERPGWSQRHHRQRRQERFFGFVDTMDLLPEAFVIRRSKAAAIF